MIDQKKKFILIIHNSCDIYSEGKCQLLLLLVFAEQENLYDVSTDKTVEAKGIPLSQIVYVNFEDERLLEMHLR